MTSRARDASVDAASAADARPPDDAARIDAAPDTGSVADTGPPGDDRAFLHADLWSTWWNDRTRCGAERTFVEICERASDRDCEPYRAAYAACDPSRVVYGQVGPEQSGERLCMRGVLPAVGGCDARAYDFTQLRFHWYGAEWAGNWPWATIKIFEAGATEPSSWSGGGLVTLSSLPNDARSGTAGAPDHVLGAEPACVLRSPTSGDAAYRTPFGAFAWIEVPTDRPVTIVAAASTNFGDMAFAGCSRGTATASPWITGAPGATLGCMHVIERRFDAGRHYVLHHGVIEELASAAPPADLLAAFSLPGAMAEGCDGRL
jgi:hypothetical protein